LAAVMATRRWQRGDGNGDAAAAAADCRLRWGSVGGGGERLALGLIALVPSRAASGRLQIRLLRLRVGASH